MVVYADYTCSDPTYPFLKSSNDFSGNFCAKKNINLNKDTNKDDFCYIDFKIKPELVKYYANNKINKCKTLNKINKIYLSEDLNIDENQLMIDNKKIPININMSCNQGSKNTDEYGYSTPTLYDQCQSGIEGSYNNSLKGWYGDVSSGNNVYRRRNQWKDRDYYREGYDQSNMSTLTNRKNGNELDSNFTQNNTIGMPYATYIPYDKYNNNNR